MANQSRQGVNLIGYLRAESGVGQVGRALASTLDCAGIPYSLCPFDLTRSRQLSGGAKGAEKGLVYDTNLICVNADQLEVFLESSGDPRGGRRNIGVSAWEVDKLPCRMARSAGLLDEVWGISDYAADCIRPWVSKPVRSFPLPVSRPTPGPLYRHHFGLPSHAFLFLFCFDYDSVVKRKNPSGLIEAYRQAFPDESMTTLVIKTVNSELHPDLAAGMRETAAGREDVIWLDGYLSEEEQAALVASCDVYVSLHRAEGFGLTIAEAMALGKPVIATGYSANMEFMDRSNSWPVEYEIVPVGGDAEPYPTRANWAEPRLAEAAHAMRSLACDLRRTRMLGRRAEASIFKHHSPDKRARLVAQLLGPH